MLMKEKKPQQVKSPKKEEKLSERELKHLMGMDRDTYKRVNGAVRRK
jgi:hypothetical protein